MRFLRLIHDDPSMGDEMWMMDVGNGPTWCWSEDEVLLTLAKPHEESAEIKDLYRGHLGTIDEYAAFDKLWEDEENMKSQEFRDAFEACFAFADSMK